jgi:hypothetical protein
MAERRIMDGETVDARLHARAARDRGCTLHPVCSFITPWKSTRRGWDSNPRFPQGNNGFRDRPIQPLSHLSIARKRFPSEQPGPSPRLKRQKKKNPPIGYPDAQLRGISLRAQEDLNLRPLDPQSNALSTELWAHRCTIGEGGIRTHGALLWAQLLSREPDSASLAPLHFIALL